MADLTITAANVQSYGVKADGVAGGTITAGQALKLDTSNQLVVANDDTAANANVVGVALHGASANQPLAYQSGGLIDLGATLSIGKVYVLSSSGAIAPVDDLAGGEFVTVLGVATAADRLLMALARSGVAAAAAVT